MCFNAEVSMLLFVMGTLTGLKALSNWRKKGYVPLAVFVFLVCLMQLFEYLLWRSQPVPGGECPHTNVNVSYAIVILLCLQPTIYALTVGMCAGFSKGFWVAMLLGLVLVALTIVAVAHVLPNSAVCSEKDPGSCRLAWGSMAKLWEYSKALVIVYIVAYVGLFAIATMNLPTTLPIGNNLAVSAIINWSFTVSLVVALVYSFVVAPGNAVAIFGGFWCFLAAVLCVLI